eukprot:6862499-Lingulodinium_polyedra.AAC.1
MRVAREQTTRRISNSARLATQSTARGPGRRSSATCHTGPPRHPWTTPEPLPCAWKRQEPGG